MNKLHALFSFLIPALLLLWPGLLPAAPADTAEAEKIHIQADHMRYNLASGNSVYTGNVRISQGPLELTGDRVSVLQDKNEIQRITVTGQPARYHHVTEAGESIRASSQRMVYTASEHQLVLTGNAHLVQPDHELNSERIIYDTEKKLIIAGSSDSGSSDEDEQQRVKIILTPHKTTPAPAANQP